MTSRAMVFPVPLPRLACVARISCAVSLGLGLCLGTLPSKAQESCLEFRAEQMTLDPKQETIELVGDVDVWCGPYQLRSESMQILSEIGQVHVDGPAFLTLCPCDRAPISMGFRRADIRPSGDVTLEEPTLRVGDTPVFWMPWIWLRPPDRIGLLVPRLAWRADGGLLAGPGVRVPWQESDGSQAWIDVYLSGYSRGGFELEPSIVTPSSSTRLRVDRMDGDLVRVLSQGVSRTTHPGGLSWQVDMSRGSRGRTGLMELREAARPFDDGRAFLDLRPSRSTFLQTGMVAAGPRAQGRLQLGPSLFMDLGGGLGEGMSWQAGGAIRVLDEDGPGSFRAVSAGGRLLGGRWLGPLKLSLDGQLTMSQLNSTGRELSDLAAWSSLEAGLPLRRPYEGSVHLLEPFLRAAAIGTHRKHEAGFPMRPGAVQDGGRWLAVAGGRTSLGRGDRGARLDLSMGGLGGGELQEATTVLLGRVGVHAGSWRLDGEGSALSRGDERGALAILRATLGGARTAGMAAELATRSRVDPIDARAFSPSGVTWTPVSELSDEGTSLSVSGHLPIGSGLRVGASTDWDAKSERWLAAGSGLVLEHPCGCAQGKAWVSQRVGRKGTDGWLVVELR